MVIFPYDTESKSRNVLASPLGEEDHEVAKGVQANWIHRGAPRPANPVRRHPAKSVWTVVILIMILDVDVTAAGGQDRDGASYRRSALYTLLPLRGISPQGETRDMRHWMLCHI